MRAASFAAAALVVASCAITPGPTKLPELETVPASFEMSGRLAVRQGDRSDIAKLRWTHEGARDTWIISSPLGNEVARIESAERGATLQRAGSAPESAPDFRSLTEQLLGVAIEPRQLAHWLHSPVGGLSTGGWTVQVQETQRAGAVDIARLVLATRGETSVRLVVDEYRALAN
jgi:outer membrane biogenesis lipoprotein LolB